MGSSLVTRFSTFDPYEVVFHRLPHMAISTAGTPYLKWIEVGMPSLPSGFLDTVFYLYPSVSAAQRGEAFGGTGFFVGVPVGHDRSLIFAVTNWHVAVQGGSSVIRVNTRAGGVDIFELDPSQWWFEPKGHDLAIAQIPLDQNRHAFQVIPTELAATDEQIRSKGIGVGEDIFMIGRFVDHDGADTNVPAVRFGNISVMPQPVLQPTGARLPSYILDVHSRTGYSGSPIFAYRTLGADFNSPGLVIGGDRSRFIALLGIQWGQFPEEWEIKSGKTLKSNAAAVEGNEKYITGMSGMTLAVPITALLDIFERHPFKERIEQTKADVERRFGLAPIPEIAKSKEDGNLTHKEDFMRLLNAAAKTKPQADRT